MIKIYTFIIFLFLLINYSFAGSIYFYEDFNNSATINNTWRTNFRYGRGGLFYMTTNQSSWGPAATSKFALINNQAVFTGSVQSHWEYGNGSTDDDWSIAYWCGNTIKLTNANGIKSFTASATNPFGFKVLRTWARLDPDNEDYNDADNNSEAVEGDIWLVEENGISGTNNGETFDNALCLYEMFRYGVNTNSTLGGYRSQWGSYVFAEARFNLKSVDFFNGTFDLVNDSSYGLEWNYEDLWEGNVNSNCTNTNTLGIMITHDGSKMSFYINPNPLGISANPFPNEYAKVGEKAVGWYSNLRVMLGHGSHYHTTEMEQVRYDDFLIRTVADTIKSEIYQKNFSNEGRAEYFCSVQPIFNDTDSGIGELTLKIPGNHNFILKDLSVYSEWGDNVNNGIISPLKIVNRALPEFPNQVSYKFIDNKLKLFFCEYSDERNGVINSSIKNPEIKIKFILFSDNKNISFPSTGFKGFVNCRKYADTGYSKTSTTADKMFFIKNIDMAFIAERAVINKQKVDNK